MRGCGIWMLSHGSVSCAPAVADSEGASEGAAGTVGKSSKGAVAMASVPGELHGGTIPRGEDEVGSNGDTQPERFRVLAAAGGAGEVLCLGGGGWSRGDPASGRRQVEPGRSRPRPGGGGWRLRATGEAELSRPVRNQG
jgi:hypothetical protein